MLAKYTHSPLRPDDILEAEITSSGVQSGLAKSAGKFQYLKDALGTVTDITDSNGNIVQRYDYSVYGKILSVKDGNANDITASPSIHTSFTFTGREWDEDAGIYYYRARYYDANMGRFLQQDPDPGRIINPVAIVNKYVYVGNSPIMRMDPSGKSWLGDLAVGIVALAAAVFGGPLVAAALLGTSANIAVFALVSTIAGAAIGGVAGGLTNTTIGNGTFEAGFRIGAVAGAIGGAIGGAAFYSSRGSFLRFANEVVYQTSLHFVKSEAFPLSATSAAMATITIGGFTYDQYRKPCKEGESYNWKTNKCEPSSVTIPIY